MVFLEIKRLMSENQFENAISLIDEVDKKYKLEASIYKARIYIRQGEYSKAFNIANESISKSKRNNNKTMEVAARVVRVNALINIDQYEIGVNYALETEKMFENLHKRGQTHIQIWIGLLFNSIGNLYDYNGDLINALKYYKKGLDIRRKIDDNIDVAKSLNNIGEIYRAKGELDLALEYYLQSLNQFAQIDNPFNLAIVYSNIGVVYNQKGNTELSLDYLQKSYKLMENHENKVDLVEILYQLIVLYLEKNDLQQAIKYFSELKNINDLGENKFVNMFTKVGEAIILKHTPRLRSKARAQKLLEEFVGEEIVMVQITAFALLNLCEMLLNELKIYGNEDILPELQNYADRLLQIAIEQSSSLIHVEAHLIQSKIALLEYDIDGARKLLTEAQLISEVKGLQRLAIRISIDHDALLSSIDRWNKLIVDEAPLEDRLELANFEHVMKNLVKQKMEIPEIIEETPLLFLILDKAGNSKYTLRFSNSRVINETLVGVFLTAIISFTKTAFSSDEPVERIKHQDYTIILKSVQSYLICYVFHGPSYFALQKINSLLNMITEDPSIIQLFDKYKFQTIPEDDPKLREIIQKVFADLI
ncbi:MAG: tetratricopeptide repeat protein [Candidatus Heimdallarchaeota archaeon]|nr:tetratricopeptide repeat protein [Candidatus Heimdallarchaeota archaeon]